MTSVKNKSVDVLKLHNNSCTDFVKGKNFCKRVLKLHNNCCTDFVKKETNFCKRWLLLTKPGSGILSLN